MKKFIIFCFFLCFYAYSQEIGLENVFCPSYSFRLNDTLLYLVHSYDSIVVDYEEPLLRIRNEVYRYICDSILEGKKFRFQCELIDFGGIDIKDTNRVEYSESEWIGRKIWLILDSVGNRFSFILDDSNRSGKSPGGFFQPHLFFRFSDGCKKQNETWLIRTTDDLPENGIPVSILRHTMLFKMIGEVDTLGDKAIRTEFIRTGQGSVRLNNPILPMKLSAVINSYGFLDISKDKKIPIHLFTTVEQKVTLTSEEKLSHIMHYIHTNYRLIEFRAGNEIQHQKFIRKKQKK